MSVGCQFVTCVLKQDRCSLTASLVFSLQTCFPASPLRALSLLTLALGIYSCHLSWGLASTFCQLDSAWEVLAAEFALYL